MKCGRPDATHGFAPTFGATGRPCCVAQAVSHRGGPGSRLRSVHVEFVTDVESVAGTGFPPLFRVHTFRYRNGNSVFLIKGTVRSRYETIKHLCFRFECQIHAELCFQPCQSVGLCVSNRKFRTFGLHLRRIQFRRTAKRCRGWNTRPWLQTEDSHSIPHRVPYIWWIKHWVVSVISAQTW